MCFELFLFKLRSINEIIAALKIPYDATILLQNASFTLSDFFGCWLAIIRRLEKLVTAPEESTGFAQILLSKILERKSCLLNNEAIICAVYLHKRFAFKLSVDEKKIAQVTLERLFERVKKAKSAIPSADSFAEDHSKDDSFEEEYDAAGLPRTVHSNNRMSTSSSH